MFDPNQVIDADYFDPFLKVATYGMHDANSVGLGIIPQEGSGAGRVSFTPKNHTPSQVAEEISAVLNHGLNGRDEEWELGDCRYWLVKGAFESPVGVLWTDASVPKHVKDAMEFMTSLVENVMATSKQSYFHRVFSAHLAEYGRATLYDTLAKAIKDGLYCDFVIVWKREGAILASKYPDSDFSVPLNNSVAGESCAGGVNTIHDFDKFDQSRLHFKDFLEINKLKSAFFIPIYGDTERTDIADGVAGVFYHRRYGTTEIDKVLCEYAVRYFELLWGQKQSLDSAEQELAEYRNTGPFYRDAVAALADFHDLHTLHLGLASTVSSIKSLAHTRPDILEHTSTAEACVAQLGSMVKLHRDALTIAPDFKEILGEDGTEVFSLTDVVDLVNQEIRKLNAAAKVERCKISFNSKLSSRILRVRKKDCRKIVSNLLSNSIRAMSGRSFGGGRIQVETRNVDGVLEILVKDNGVGIPENDLSSVWDIHYTTHGADGGRGIGLTVVKAICNKDGLEPEIDSDWGEGTEIVARIPIDKVKKGTI